MLRTVTPLLAGLSLLVAPALAHAEEPTKNYPDCGREPTDAEVAAAKGAFQAGNASFNEADYTRAIDYWEDAYRRDCTANPLLLNLARAYELAGRKRQAVVSLETFVAREPSSGEKDQINRRIEVLKKKIADEDAAAAAAPVNPPPNGATPATGATPTPVGGEPPADAPKPQVKRSPWPWILIGTGGAITIVGAIGYAANKKKLDDADAQCDDPSTTAVVEGRAECFSDSAVKSGSEAQDAMTASGAIAGIGLAVAAGGVVWLIVDRSRKPGSAKSQAPRRTAIVPVYSGAFKGLSVSGSF